MITKELLEKRLEKLLRGMNQLEQNAAQITAGMAAQRGAIGEIEALLKLFDELVTTDVNWNSTPEPLTKGPQLTE